MTLETELMLAKASVAPTVQAYIDRVVRFSREYAQRKHLLLTRLSA